MVKPDGYAWRRVVPSPVPLRIFEQRAGGMAARPGLCCVLRGGGGIPTMYRPGTQTLVGVEAVIDKDRASCLLAKDLHADTLVIATDTDAVYFGQSAERVSLWQRFAADCCLGVSGEHLPCLPRIWSTVRLP